jgi:predicted ester cyclase
MTLAQNLVSSTADDGLPRARSTISDSSLPAARLAAMTLAARRYFGFWDTGDAHLAEAALSPSFVDRTLPPGRPQGPRGPILASDQFRRAVPNLRVEVEEMLIVGDRVVGRLRFRGHFAGVFAERRGDGRPVDFIATDVYRIEEGRIAENWHLEDNLTLLQQLGAVAR